MLKNCYAVPIELNLRIARDDQFRSIGRELTINYSCVGNDIMIGLLPGVRSGGRRLRRPALRWAAVAGVPSSLRFSDPNTPNCDPAPAAPDYATRHATTWAS